MGVSIEKQLPDLPEEILLKIFIYATPWLGESVSILKVCRFWYHVMKRRFSMVKYIIRVPIHDHFKYEFKYISSGAFLLHHQDPYVNRKFLRFLDQFPKLKALELVCPQYDDDDRMWIGYLNTRPGIKAICFLDAPIKFSWNFFAKLSAYIWPRLKQGSSSNTKCLKHVKVLYYENYNRFTSSGKYGEEVFTGLTQFYNCQASSNCSRISHKLHNARRIHATDLSFLIGEFELRPTEYNGPLFEKLEVLELSNLRLASPKDLNFIIKLCPNLKSLFIQFFDPMPYLIMRSPSGLPKHGNVENLVIEWGTLFEEVDWNYFEPLLEMMPNIKNLGVKYFHGPNDTDLPRLLGLLGRLQYIEVVFSCLKESDLAERITSLFIQIHRRPVKCDVIDQDYSEILGYDKIGKEFDFMKYIFHRNFDDAPNMMIE